MNSLYHALLIQHPKQLTPVRCAEQTIVQLHRYFEDVVLENDLSALVIESLPPAAERPLRDLARVRELGRQAQAAFFFVATDDGLTRLPLRASNQDREPKLLPSSGQDEIEERFVVIADARFSGLLASVRDPQGKAKPADGNEVLWTFEPDVVYTALEYLMARVSAERPLLSADFVAAVRASMPKATSLQLTVSVTAKLVRMLQEQAGREIAVNRIATAIRNAIELDDILQTTVDEVGRALGVMHCALAVNGENNGPKNTKVYFRDHGGDPAEESEIMVDLEAYSVRLASHLQTHVMDGRTGTEEHSIKFQPLAVVPLIYQGRFMGALLVRSDDPSRCWQETELLLLRTVADQVIVAVDRARLFAQTQQQALTDVLTGCFNRRSFELQLDRELRTARRDEQPLSLIMCDIDSFKRINENFGHDAGDVVLRVLGETFREELRGRDTTARYGGEEFAIILPEVDAAGALVVGERLCERLSKLEIPGVGRVTASFGLASFPGVGKSRDQLISAAERALYDAKRTGRNKVVVYEPEADEGVSTAPVSPKPVSNPEESSGAEVPPETVASEGSSVTSEETVAPTGEPSADPPDQQPEEPADEASAIAPDLKDESLPEPESNVQAAESIEASEKAGVDASNAKAEETVDEDNGSAEKRSNASTDGSSGESLEDIGDEFLTVKKPNPGNGSTNGKGKRRKVTVTASPGDFED